MQLWHTAPQTHSSIPAALACLLEAQRQISNIPGAEEDWELCEALGHIDQALTYLQEYASAEN